MRQLLGRRLRTEPALDIRRASRRLRTHLDTDQVVRAVVDEVVRALRPTLASVYLATGKNEPQRAFSAGRITPDSGSESGAPPPVRRVVRRHLPVGRATYRASPIIAPRSGLIGVLYVERDGIPPVAARFIDELAAEAAFAMEAANLYEHAVAGKERSEAILGRVGDAVVVTDPGGRIVEWNQAAETIFAVQGSHAVGRSCAEILGLIDGDGTFDCSQGCALMRAFPALDQVIGKEVWRERKDGRRQPLLANVASVVDKEGSPIEIVHSMRDITRLKEADEAKTLFLATASHELKTPLTVIQGFAQLLLGPQSPSETDREMALEAIERRSKQLNKIVERLLLSSRIEAGRAEIFPRKVDLAPLLDEHIATTAAATERAIGFTPADELPAVHADPDAVSTVVDHLLDNASKYSPKGEPIEVVAVSDERTVHIAVRDRGIGMDAEQAAKCFDKFWQAESSDIRRFGGTGIGLYIVRSLVEAMGGTITVQSAPDEGSTFTVTLPRFDAPPETPRVQSEPDEQLPVEPSVIREFMRQLGIPGRSPS